jgi:hypothetical protein
MAQIDTSWKCVGAKFSALLFERRGCLTLSPRLTVQHAHVRVTYLSKLCVLYDASYLNVVHS